jgi:hypothetical protein
MVEDPADGQDDGGGLFDIDSKPPYTFFSPY